MSSSCPRCGAKFAGQTVGSHVRRCPVTWQELFWARVDKSGPGGCWIWTAAKERHGYGHFRVENKDHRAHRLAYELHHGPIAKGLEIIHACDVKACVNPAHLRAGTHHENMQDAKAKGIHAHGERNSHAKLTEDDVRAIRREFVRTGPKVSNARALAKRYGITPTNIYQILNWQTWEYVR